MKTASATIWNEDCVQGMRDRLGENSVDLSVFSLPFEELFSYSGRVEDIANNGSTVDIRTGRFALNMRFFAAQLLRVTRPGTNVCCHCQQLVAWKVQHGFMGRRDFRGALIEIFSAAGFHYTGEFAIQKNPQRIAQALNLHSLLFITGKRNANMLAPCPNDYVLIFQKPGECEHPVRAIYSDYAEKMTPAEWETAREGYDDESTYEDYVKWWTKDRRDAKTPRNHQAVGWLSTEEWIRDAHGIWTDILEVDVLDGARSKHLKEDEREPHVCPLQLEVIRRCVQLYSNPVSIQPDVTVLDPFMGIGSVAWVCLGAASPTTKLALHAPRNVVGFELKDSYARQALANVKQAKALVKAAEKHQHPLLATLD